MKSIFCELKKNLHTILRAIRIINEIDRVYLIQQIAKGIVEALFPFVTIIFSARIIDEITADMNINKLVIYILSALISGLIIAFSKELLDAKIAVRQSQWDSKVELYFSKINYDIQFIYLENPDIKLLKNKIKTNNDATYAGLTMVIMLLKRLISSIISLVTSSVLLVGIFQRAKDVGNGKIVHFLNSYGSMVFLIVLILALEALTVLCNNKQIQKEYQEWSKLPESNRLIGYYNDMLKDNVGSMDIRIYNQKPLIMRELGKWTENPVYIKNISNIKRYYGRISIMVNGMVQISINLFIVLKVFFGLYSVGSYVQYTSCLGSFTSAVTGIIDIVNRFIVNNEFLQDTFQYFDLPKEIKNDNGKKVLYKDEQHVFEFKEVSFRYPAGEKNVIQNFNLKLKTGKKYAIVGMNGSGKSTFIKLLCGLYKADSGKILIDGTNIWDYDTKSYRELFSAVFQDFNLFSFPLGQNVAGSFDFDEKKVEKCLEKVGFSERYASMEKKMETVLYKVFSDDGVEISGGESQKIAIARALYRNAPIMIMDEPTSALDPKSEFDIYARLNEIVEDKTAIFVSHRLSSCKFCDEIIVFDQGRIIQMGSHDELLMDEEGKYREMWDAQAQYY